MQNMKAKGKTIVGKTIKALLEVNCFAPNGFAFTFC
jgi:hypothetical protein